MIDILSFPFEGINKGSQIFLHLLKSLKDLDHGDRVVGFYHRNSSESRKSQILDDLKKPLFSKDKKLLCVVATVSLGKEDIVGIWLSNLKPFLLKGWVWTYVCPIQLSSV